jgi:hypothetical protein
MRNFRNTSRVPRQEARPLDEFQLRHPEMVLTRPGPFGPFKQTVSPQSNRIVKFSLRLTDQSMRLSIVHKSINQALALLSADLVSLLINQAGRLSLNQPNYSHLM